MNRDTLFERQAKAGSFVFDQRVADVFDDMVNRSVPGYQAIQLLVADLAVTFARGGCIYDLGCSTGATIRAISQRTDRPLKVIAVDNSAEMLDRCRANTRELPKITVEYRCADFIRHDPFGEGRADAVIMNLALQFVRPPSRAEIVKRCFDHTGEGGALILVEKTVEADPVLNGLFVEYYHRFKREMGYSEMEIASKREALENVLIPYRRDENLALLRDAGFRHVAPFFQWFNFSGFLAVR